MNSCSKGNIFLIFLIEMALVLDGFEATVQITFTLGICSIAICATSFETKVSTSGSIDMLLHF